MTAERRNLLWKLGSMSEEKRNTEMLAIANCCTYYVPYTIYKAKFSLLSQKLTAVQFELYTVYRNSF